MSEIDHKKMTWWKTALTLCPLIPGRPGVPGNPRAPCVERERERGMRWVEVFRRLFFLWPASTAASHIWVKAWALRAAVTASLLFSHESNTLTLFSFKRVHLRPRRSTFPSFPRFACFPLQEKQSDITKLIMKLWAALLCSNVILWQKSVTTNPTGNERFAFRAAVGHENWSF